MTPAKRVSVVYNFEKSIFYIRKACSSFGESILLFRKVCASLVALRIIRYDLHKACSTLSEDLRVDFRICKADGWFGQSIVATIKHLPAF